MKKILLILFVSLFQNFIFGATITSTGTGENRNATSSWFGRIVPTAADDVVITSGVTITVDKPESAVAPCSITTTTNASALTCGTSPLSSCGGVLYIGDGTSAMSLIMNQNLDLTCLGVIQLIVRNNATLDFSGANNDLKLASGSVIVFETGSAIYSGGGCSASDRIYIGGSVVGNCNGSGSIPSFSEIVANGGINEAGILSGNQYICTSGTNTTTFASTSTGGTWSSGNTSVATVNSSSGLVTAVAAGTAIITYTRSGVSATRNVYVSSSGPATPGTITGTTPQCPALTAQVYSIAAVSGASSYTWYVPTGWTITAGQGTTSVTVTTGNSSQSGNISVSATNGCGTGNAQYFYVAIDPVPSAPGTAGAYSPTCTGFTAQWAYTGYATKYFLDVSTNSSFSSFVSGYNNLDVGNVLSNTLAGLNPGITYYYRVRAYSNCGTSPSSTTMNYATTASPTAPPVATAADNLGCNAATLHWNSVTNATGYYIDIATDSGFTSFVSGYNNFYIGYANYYASGLPGGTLYYRIRATNSCGVTTASSNTISFATSGPVGGTVTSTQTICSGTSPASLTLTGNSSPVDHWEKASDINFTTDYGYIGVNTSVLSGATIGNLSQNTYFRAVSLQTSPSYCNGYSTAVLITVSNSISAASSSPTPCINTVMTTITHTTSGFTGIGTPTNLPAGVTASFASNTVTISGTPTVSGTFNYTIPLTGGSCGAANATGTITVRTLFTSGTISATGETICSNTIPTATIGSTVAASGGDTTITYQWQYSTDNTFATGVTTVSNNTATYKPTQTLTQTTYYRRQAKDGSCNTTFTSSANIWTINIAATSTITLSSAAGTDSQTKCINTAITNITYTTIGATGATFSGLPTGVNGAWASNVVTISGTPSVSGTFNYTVTLTGGCGTVTKTGSIIVDTLNAPSLGTITSPTCTVPTGSVVLTGLPTGSWTLNRYGTSTATTTGTGSTTTISGLALGTYTFTVSNGTCTSDPSLSLNITQTTNTWDGVKWSKTGDVTPPTSDDIIVFAGNYTSSGDLNGCSCIVNSGTVTIQSGHTLTIANGVNVNGGTLTFDNNASLLQINNVINTGSITYKRNSAPMKNFDYTYWASPVAGQTLFDLSPNTLADKYMSYSGTGWQISYGGTAVMQPGIGYIIRTPKGGTWPAPHPEVVVFPYSQPVQFKGVPNNGNITSSQSMISGKFYLIGNPYPSALIADEFLYNNTNNNTVLNGTIYLWTHNTAITSLKYTSDDYASYNALGGVTATSGGSEPLGYIAAGQSFFGSAKANGTVEFNNSMRATGDNGNNAQFFKPGKTAKTAKLERDRLWLNMTNTGGAFKQTLIGYAEGATNSYDNNFDGLTFDGNSYLDLYSINGTDNLTIQGRALPFADTDVVPMGYRSTVAGSFTIAINKADGALANQRIYLEDKQTGTINDLTAQNYTFSSTVGTFNNRFVLRYTNKTLGTGEFETVENSITVVSQDKTIAISSSSENLSKVFIYDISGKQLYKKQNVGNLELSIQHLAFAQQVLLVKVVLENGYTTTKKIIFK